MGCWEECRPCGVDILPASSLLGALHCRHSLWQWLPWLWAECWKCWESDRLHGRRYRYTHTHTHTLPHTLAYREWTALYCPAEHIIERGSNKGKRWQNRDGGGRGKGRRTVFTSHFSQESMWITQRSTGRLFNESTGRGQQLVACVWAGRIRPLALGSSTPPYSLSLSLSLSSSPNAPFIRPSSPPPPPHREWSPLSVPLLPVLELGLSRRALPVSQHQNQSRTKLSSTQRWLKPPSTDQTQVPDHPVLGEEKEKWAKTERDINRMVGQYNWERWMEGKNNTGEWPKLQKKKLDISF